MPGFRLHGSLITLCLLLGCRAGRGDVASDSQMALAPAVALPPPSSYAAGPGPTSIGPTPIIGPGAVFNPADDTYSQNQPSLRALPVTSTGTDGSTNRKFYTLTAELREVYDDNVNTSVSHKQSSFETSLSPSVLVDFPSVNGDISARYTFGLTYYSNQGNGGNGSNFGGFGSKNGSLQLTHELDAQVQHVFSERYSFSGAEDFSYFTEPSIMESTGSIFRVGDYISNRLNGLLSAQWTPLFSTTTSFANTIVHYEDSQEADVEDSIENTASHSFNWAVLPKVTVLVGGNVDNITYADINRGYTSFNAYIGAQWQVLPSIQVNANGGGTLTLNAQGQATESPYAVASATWQLGGRSSLEVDYSHEVVPTDVGGANGQEVDRATASFNYDITPALSAHLTGIVTSSTVSGALLTSSAEPAYTELLYDFDTGLSYHYSSMLSFDTGVTITDIDSTLAGRSYSRDQFYIGVRGTY